MVYILKCLNIKVNKKKSKQQNLNKNKHYKTPLEVIWMYMYSTYVSV